MAIITTDQEYEAALKSLNHAEDIIKQQEEDFRSAGFTEEEIKKQLNTSTYTRIAMLRDDVAYYQRLKSGDVPSYSPMTGEFGRTSLGPYLLACRIASGLSQEELAVKLGVELAEVRRRECNEYHFLSVNELEKLIAAIGVKLRFEFNKG